MARGIKTGGRQMGTPNKATLEAARKSAEIAAAGLTPLEYMLGVLRDDRADAAARFEAAKAAAPYVHPRLTAITHADPDGQPLGTALLAGTELARRAAYLLSHPEEAQARLDS